MGIPSYFSSIIKRYRHEVNEIPIIQKHDANCTVEHLLMDCNSIIYDSFHELYKQSEKYFDESVLIRRVIEKIDDYVFTIHPTETLFIAFDGVAPQAKMKQQRERRWKAEIARGMTEEIMKYEKKWSTSNITPGTTFMNCLMNAVDLHFLGNENTYNVHKIIVSGSRDHGEGEHKLFQFVREKGDLIQNDSVCIYGLDADLIMLSIFHVQRVGRIMVCREAPQFIDNDEHEGLLVLDIGRLTSAICANLGSNNILIANDYAFLCFFLGNDFLPHFPALNIRTHGIDRLLDVYKKHFLNKGKCLISKECVIVWKHVDEYIRILASMEHDWILEEHVIRDKLEGKVKTDRRRNDFTELLDENLPILNRCEEKYICPYENGWQIRYYTSLLNNSCNIKEVCQNYKEGLEWTFQYYTSACTDWQWKYNWNYPPLLCDLACCTGTPKKRTENTEPLYSQMQLKYVLPYTLWDLIPSNDEPQRAYTMVIPRHVFAYCRYLWESHLVFRESHDRD